MAEKFKFTKAAIENIPVPNSGSFVRYYDTDSNGLALYVRPSGKKSYYFYAKRHGKTHQIKLGDYPSTRIAEARRAAHDALVKVNQGIDVIKERRLKSGGDLTLQSIFDEYLAAHNLKESTIKDYLRSVKWGFSSWLNLPLTNINTPMVERKHRELGKRSPARADNSMRVLRALFRYASHKYRDKDGNPMVGINPVEILSHSRQWYNPPRKKTYIKEQDLKSWYTAVCSLTSTKHPELASTARDYYLFLLFTGLRSTEAATLKWENVDLDEKSFLLVDTKNNLTPTFPLTTATYGILKKRFKHHKSDYVFPSKSADRPLTDYRAWQKKVIEASEVQFTPHDLRRTFLTIAESLDIHQVTIKRLANHKAVEHDVTTGYIMRDVERLRRPAQRITDRIKRLTT